MPIDLAIDPAQKVVVTTCTGTVTISEMVEICIRMAQDPTFDARFSHLNDLTAVSEVRLSIPELKHFVAQRLDPFAETSKRVYVASEPFVFGMVRMYESLISLPNLAVVRSMEEGRRLLGLEEQTAAHS